MEEDSDKWLVKCPKCGYVFGDARFLSDISPCWRQCPECKRMTDLANRRWNIVMKMCEILESDDEMSYLLGQRRPTSEEEDEFMEQDAMYCD